MPTGAQRKAIERRCEELERMGRPGPERRTLEAVTKLLAFYAHGNASEDQQAIKAGVYLDAVSDLPAWAVNEAVRRWFRRQAGAENYGFAPDPGLIRVIAENVSNIARGQLVLMRRILAARPMLEPTPEERERVLKLIESGRHKRPARVNGDVVDVGSAAMGVMGASDDAEGGAADGGSGAGATG